MDWRVRGFIECKEQWHMLKQRAGIEVGLSLPSSTEYAEISEINKDDERPFWAQPRPGLSQQLPLVMEGFGNELRDCGIPMPPTTYSQTTNLPQREFPILDTIDWDALYADDVSTKFPNMGIDSSSVESFSSSGYGGSFTGAVHRKRERNRENQRLYRTFYLIYALHIES
jgi:hypothetical protein